MDLWSGFFTSIAVVFATALVAEPFLRRGGGASRAALAGAVVAVLASPLLVPSEATAFRFVVAIFSVWVVIKMYDYGFHRSGSSPSQRGFSHYLRHLLLLFMTATYPRSNRRLRGGAAKKPELVRIALSLPNLAGAALLFVVSGKAPFFGSWFWAEHLMKSVAFLLLVDSGSQLSCGLARLAGYDVVPIADRVFLSRTLTDFWRRYNRPFSSWVHKHVFLGLAGRTWKAAAALLTFCASGLIHEYIFGVALSRVQGYQMIFFTLQGIGVLATPCVDHMIRRYGVGGLVVARFLGAAFLWLTSVFFFSNFNQVFPGFYRAQPWFP